MNPIFQFLDGKEYTLDGVHGVFEHECTTSHWPYTRLHERLLHNPSDLGKQSPFYIETKRALGDDWLSDLTNGERYVDVAIELGYV